MAQGCGYALGNCTVCGQKSPRAAFRYILLTHHPLYFCLLGNIFRSEDQNNFPRTQNKNLVKLEFKTGMSNSETSSYLFWDTVFHWP